MRKHYNLDDSHNVILFTGSHFGPNTIAFDFITTFIQAHSDEINFFNIVFI